MKKVILILILISIFTLTAQEGSYFNIVPESKLRIIERSNYRIKRNGIYRGLIYRENRGILDSSELIDDSYFIRGTYYILEELTKDGTKKASQIDSSVDVEYKLFSNGQMEFDSFSTYPLLKSFPTYLYEKIAIGASWTAHSKRMVMRDDTVTTVPIYSQYTYIGISDYLGKKVHRINAKYAMRYKKGQDFNGDERLKSISGTHDVTILVEINSGVPILMRDNMKEMHLYTDGETLEKNGFILTFFKGIRGMEKNELANSIRENLKQNNLEQIDLKEVEEGLALVLNNLHFLPDQAILLDEDTFLLDTIANSLLEIEDRTFYIKGHTADVGTMESQQILSVERAFAVVQELVKRGLREDRFIYIGFGGDHPIADNKTEEGRAKNRRVEIIIMED